MQPHTVLTEGSGLLVLSTVLIIVVVGFLLIRTMYRWWWSYRVNKLNDDMKNSYDKS